MIWRSLEMSDTKSKVLSVKLFDIGDGMDENSINDSFDRTVSDSDRVSSGSTSGAQDRNLPRGFVVSAKFWQGTNVRLRGLQELRLGLQSSHSSKFVNSPWLSQSRMYSDGSMSSPIRSSKVYSTSMSGLMRGVSPSRVRSSIGSSPWDKTICAKLCC